MEWAMKFTENSRIWSVRHCKQFRPFKKYIINPSRIASKIQFRKISYLKTIYHMDIPSTVSALNEMRRRVLCGQKLYYPFVRPDTGIYAFLIGDNRPFILLLPGGAFNEVCSLVEGFNTAISLNEKGYNVFIGQYGTKEYAHFPNPQEDVAHMLEFIFAHAEDMRVNTAGYAVCGFSAGGHVAASWGVKAYGYAKYGLPKPKAEILAYPVITMGEKAHLHSRERFLGEECDNPAYRDKYSIEKQVDGDYPPTFAWHCKRDKGVPAANSEMLIEALKSAGVRCEYMPVDGDLHGLGLGVGSVAEGWLDKAVEFYESL